MLDPDDIATGVRRRAATRDLLNRWGWTYFVSLATNDPMLSPTKMRELIRDWDARVNRKLNGPRWQKQPETRLWSVYALEKPTTNPHWHALVMIEHPDPAKRAWQLEQFPAIAEAAWIDLVKSGTVDVQLVYDQRGAIKYIAKQLTNSLQYEQLIFPGELK